MSLYEEVPDTLCRGKMIGLISIGAGSLTPNLIGNDVLHGKPQ